MSPPSNPWSHTAAWDRWLAPDWTAGSQSANRFPPTTSPRSACRSHSDGHSMKPTSRARWSFSVTPRGVGTSGPIPGLSAGRWRSATDDERSSGLPRRGSPGCFEGSRQNSGSHSTTPAGSRPTTADSWSGGCTPGCGTTRRSSRLARRLPSWRIRSPGGIRTRMPVAPLHSRRCRRRPFTPSCQRPLPDLEPPASSRSLCSCCWSARSTSRISCSRARSMASARSPSDWR